MELNIHSFQDSQENKNTKKLINFQNYIESSLKISQIENKENDQTKKFDTINSYNFDSIINNNHRKNNIKKIKNKLTKKDLNNIPIPIFSCIYCSNEIIAFRHFISQKLYDKYFLMTSIFDIKLMDKIIKINPFVENYQNYPIINIILKSTEFIRGYYKKKEIKFFFKNNNFDIKCKENNINIAKTLMQKLENKIKKNKNNNKYNQNKLLFDDYKSSYQKINNNSTFANSNLTNNKNSITNTAFAGSFPNFGLSSSLNNNNENFNNINNNNINIYFNPNNIMGSIVEKIEKNEESNAETEEKFLDILDKQNNSNNKRNKIKISFEEKIYDIWNPDITLISEEEDNKLINIFSERNIRQIKRVKNLSYKNKKTFKGNECIINNNKNIINYNNETKAEKKIINGRNIFSPYLNNNLKKKNLMDLINTKYRRNFHIEPLLPKQKFFTRDANLNENYNNIYLINNIQSTKFKESYNNNNLSEGKPKIQRNLLRLLNSKSDIIKNLSKNNSSKLIRKTNPSRDHISQILKKKNYTLNNFFDVNSKIINQKNKNIYDTLIKKKNSEINLYLDLNNRKIDSLSKFLILTNRSSLNPSLKEKDMPTSLPNINSNLSPIYNYKYKNNEIKINNQKKKFRIKNNFRKINSNYFLQNRCISLSRPSLKSGILNIK